MQKLKRVNASATFNVSQDEWLVNLFVGNLKTKTLNLPMGGAYEFQMVLCACADGRLIMEIIFQAEFEKEMKAHQMDPKLVKRVGNCSVPTEIFCEDFLNFYLEDLIIKNTATGEVKKTNVRRKWPYVMGDLWTGMGTEYHGHCNPSSQEHHATSFESSCVNFCYGGVANYHIKPTACFYGGNYSS